MVLGSVLGTFVPFLILLFLVRSFSILIIGSFIGFIIGLIIGKMKDSDNKGKRK